MHASTAVPLKLDFAGNKQSTIEKSWTRLTVAIYTSNCSSANYCNDLYNMKYKELLEIQVPL